MKNMAMALDRKELGKSRTGISGLDEITHGGLPAGRSTLVCGGPGSGKTLLAMEFLVHGASEYGEPGVFMAFEETAEELTENVASLGFDLDALAARKLLVIHHVQIAQYALEETGEYDVEGVFIRLGQAIDSIKAKRVAIDTIEVLFARVADQAIVREALHRLFGWLKKKGVTVIVTSERDDNRLSRYSMEEYVSDCVISLAHRVLAQTATRQMRVVKYRGSAHSTREYSFVIAKSGISILKDIHMGPREVFAGSVSAQEEQARKLQAGRNEEIERQQLDLQHKHDLLDAQIADLRARVSAEEARIEQRQRLQTARTVVRTRRGQLQR